MNIESYSPFFKWWFQCVQSSNVFQLLDGVDYITFSWSKFWCMDVMYILDACVWRLVEAARPMALLSMKVRMSSSMVLVVPRQWHGRYPFPVRPTPSRYAVNGYCERCSNCFRLTFDVSLGVAIDIDVLTFADISFHAWVSYSVRLDGQGRKSGCFQRWVDMDFPKIHSLGKSHLVCQSIKVQDDQAKVW